MTRQLLPLAALLVAAPAVSAGPGGVPVGTYECWANGSARMNMNFRVTSPGTYTKTGGGSGGGRMAVGPGGRLTLTGTMMESMPAGFIAVYHAPGGHPTVSFRSPRGAEAAFCERAGG